MTIQSQSAPVPAVFSFESNRPLRVVERDGNPWFVAADVCAALDLANPAMAIQPLDDDEKGLSSTYTLGGSQQLAIVSESGLYTLILRCRDATTPGTLAHRFRKWVTSEVLPSLRQTGRYEAPAALPPSPVGYRRVLLVLRDNGTFEAKQVQDSAVMFAPEDLPQILADSTSGVFARSLLPAIIGAAAERLAGLPAPKPSQYPAPANPQRPQPINPPSDVLSKQIAVFLADRQATTVAEVIEALGLPKARASESRVGTYLRRLGWAPRQQTWKGVSGVRVYQKLWC